MKFIFQVFRLSMANLVAKPSNANCWLDKASAYMRQVQWKNGTTSQTVPNFKSLTFPKTLYYFQQNSSKLSPKKQLPHHTPRHGAGFISPFAVLFHEEATAAEQKHLSLVLLRLDAQGLPRQITSTGRDVVVAWRDVWKKWNKHMT